MTSSQPSQSSQPTPTSPRTWLMRVGFGVCVAGGLLWVVLWLLPHEAFVFLGASSVPPEPVGDVVDLVGPNTPANTKQTPATLRPVTLHMNIVKRHPHDASAFTQGLEMQGERLFESTGLYEHSSLREVNLVTGEVLRRVPIDDALFAEGLTLVGDQLVQLTWRAGKAFAWDRDTFALLHEHTYKGEGWGLCYNGDSLVMSDGSATLTFRDPNTFEVKNLVTVTLRGRPLTNLNELECVKSTDNPNNPNNTVYANVWQTNTIVRIDPTTGHVTGTLDVHITQWLTLEERRRADVLNGIAYQPKTGHFFITGKRWPWLLEARVVEDAMTEDVMND